MIPPHLGSLNVRGAFVIGLGEHAHDADQDLLDALDGTPPLRCALIVVWIISGRVQDRYADEAGRIDWDEISTGLLLSFCIGHRGSKGRKMTARTIRMPYVAQKLHCRWRKWIVFGELEFGGEDTALERGAVRSLDESFPDEDVIFGNGTGGDSFWRRGGEKFVFVEEAFGGYGARHGWT